MSSFVNICKYDPNSNKRFNKIVLNDLNLKVKTLSELVSKEFQLNEDNFDLMCFGRVLNEDKTLDSYEITNGTTVFVIKKTNLINPKEKTMESELKEEPKEIKSKINQSDIQHMVIALKTALMDSKFRQMLDNLSEVEHRENLMAVTPGLREDPTTLAILQDPDLLSTLTEPTNIHKVLEKHPCLLEAATYLSATFHEDTIANESGPSGLNRSSSAFNYSLDAMSDDEDMDSESSAEPAQNASGNSTAQRIAELMVRAYQSNQNSGNSSNSSGVITQDMLRQALQHSNSQSSMDQPSTSAPQTQTSSSAPTTSASTPTSSGPSVSSRMRSWATQMQQLRDLGINDEIIALQALEATDGDVQAAINIIFSDNN